MRRTVALATTVAAVVTLGACSSPSKPQVPMVAAPAAAKDDIPSVTVRGVGRVSGKPDLLTVVLGVETTAAHAVDALRDNNQRASSVIDVLKGRGVDPKDIQTSQLSINPQFDRDGRRITGYSVSNLVTAKLRDLGGAGALIDDAAAKAGDGIRVQSLSFSIEDTSKLVVEARKSAVKAAREQADQLTAAAGVKLGHLITIAEESSEQPPVIQYDRAAGQAGAASAPIEAGSQELRLSVTVVYAVEG
jgi:uncharacterized protein YggE